MGGAWFKLTLSIRGYDVIWDYFGCPEDARNAFIEIAKIIPLQGKEK